MPGIIGFEEERRYAELVERIFGSVGLVPPGITLESDRPEYSLHKRERLWWFRQAIGASVGVRSGFGVFSLPVTNPLVAGLLVVVTHIFNDQAVQAQVGITVGGLPANYVNAAPVTTRDSRSTAIGARVISRTAGAGGTPGAFEALLQASMSVPLQLPIVLGPGGACILEGTADNVAIGGAMFGYERPATQEELGA